MTTSYWRVWEYVHTNILSFGKTMTLVVQGYLKYGVVHEINMLCVQQVFFSKPLVGYSYL